MWWLVFFVSFFYRLRSRVRAGYGARDFQDVVAVGDCLNYEAVQVLRVCFQVLSNVFHPSGGIVAHYVGFGLVGAWQLRPVFERLVFWDGDLRAGGEDVLRGTVKPRVVMSFVVWYA